MNKLMVFCSLLYMTLFFVSAHACQSSHVTAKMAEESDSFSDVRPEKGLLWEISGNGLTESSFLFGTIHMIGEEDYFLPPGAEDALMLSDRVVFEINMEEMNDISALMPIIQKAFMSNGTTLKDLLSEEDYTLVKVHFNKLGMPLFLFEKIKPMFLTVFASGDFDPTDMQSGRIKSYEMEFMDMASKSNKEIGGLETIDFQLSIFDSIPYKDQADMLVEAIRTSDLEGDQFKEIVDIYKNQDIEAMYRMMGEDEGISEYEDILLVKRNINWIPQMKEMMKSKRTFFAVGAGHLGGPKGVIKLLRDEGYEVRRYGAL